MMRFADKALIGLYCACFVTSALAQPAAEPKEHPAHVELRALRDDLLDAFKKKDIDRMLSHLTDNIVITLQNGETLHGRDAVRAFHERMSGGNQPQVELMNSDFKVDELSTLYGDNTAVASGSMDDHFKMRTGMSFDLHSRWTATLVKPADQWKLAAFQISTNMFDNGVSQLQIQWASVKMGGFGLAAGLLCGAIAGIVWQRRKAKSINA
jgi:ketosteroid isomerase-like protein